MLSPFVPHCLNSQPESLITSFPAACLKGYRQFSSIGFALEPNF